MTDLQSTNRVKVSKVRETTFGVTPANPVFKNLRITGTPSLAGAPQTVTSNEIRSDRQVSDLILVAKQAGGDLAGELSFNTYDDDFEEALQSTWAANPNIIVATLDTEISDVSATVLTVVTPQGTPFKTGMLVLTTGFTTAANNNIISRVVSSTATSITFPAASFTIEGAPIPVGATARVVGFQAATAADVQANSAGLTSTTLDFTTLGIVAGQWLKVGGTAANTFFATAANNDWVRVQSVAAHALVFDRKPVGWATDTATGVLLEVFMGDFLTNSTTKRSNTVERQYLDQSPVLYEYLTGLTLDKFSLTADAAKIVTTTRSYIGASSSDTTTRISGATDIAAGSNTIINASSNVGRIGFNGATITGPNFVMTATMDISNNIRRQQAVGSIGAVGTGNGEFTVTGTLKTYFGDKTVLDIVNSNALASFDIRLGGADTLKSTYVLDFPSIKLSSGAPDVSGKNADVMLTAGFQAIRDATLGYTMSAGRFWYLPS